jgi:UBX domain-containing protein 1
MSTVSTATKTMMIRMTMNPTTSMSVELMVGEVEGASSLFCFHDLCLPKGRSLLSFQRIQSLTLSLSFLPSFLLHSLYSGLAVEPNADDMAGGGGARDSVFSLAEQGGSDDSAQVRRTITMYRDGFVVDDGPYRRLDDSANAEFLRSLAQGRTPQELIGAENGGNVTVGLIDKRQEEYVEQFQSFSGQGASLGASTVSGNTVDPADLPEPTVADASRPTTSIQVRLPNGQRKVIKINLDSSVLQLAAHLKSTVDAPFRLVAGFPPKPLEDFDVTVEAAGLKGAQVQVQKA